MSVKEVNPLHSRYIELTARFKACWTFHRFHDGLQKFFGRQDLAREAYDYQSLYKRLRSASQLINSSRPGAVERQLDEVSGELEKVIEALDQRDRSVTPSLQRLFFQRVKAYDERILIEMLRFYQEAQRDRSWEPDRIDKVDFLVSRLAETIAGAQLHVDRARLEKVLSRLSENVALGGVDPAKVADRVKMIRSVQGEMREVGSLEELTQRNLVEHYRSLKHGLGRLFFEASVLPRIVETNAALKTLVEELSRREEEQLFADYERISKLEQGGQVGGEILDAVNRLHSRVSGFRKQIRGGNMRLSELGAVRETLASIDALLAAKGGARGDDWVAEPSASGGSGVVAPPAPLELPELFVSVEARELLAPFLREISEAISAADPESTPEQVAASSGMVGFRLEPREVVAYRRLTGGSDCDQRLEGFLLSAAALRHRLNSKVMELHGALNSDPGSQMPAGASDQRTLLLAEWYLAQFAFFVEAQLLADRSSEAWQIKRCQIHLMRDFSGLWLEAQRLF